MTVFLVVGVLGVVLLVASIVFDGALDGALDGIAGLSTAAVGGFLAAFGFVGALLQDSAGTGVAAAAGVGAGLGVGAIATYASRALSSSATDPTPSADLALGADATVVSAIPAGGYGVVSLRLAGHVSRLNARADDAVPPGAAVVIVAVLSPTSVKVAPL